MSVILMLFVTGITVTVVPASDQDSGQPPPPENQRMSETVEGEVIELVEEGETTIGPVTQPYQVLIVELKSGEREGDQVEVSVGVVDLNTEGNRYSVGDRVLVRHSPALEEGQEELFVITDRVRTMPMAFLAIIFCAAIIALGRWKGVRAIIGLVFTFVVIIWFLIPRIIDGANPITISVLAAIFIFIFTLYMVHGIGRMTTAAAAGTTVSLAITGILAWIFVRVSHLTGMASEEAGFLQVIIGGSGVNLQGLLLAGIIIGALGVLDDVTVSQSSTIFELRRANPNLTATQLFTSGINVGRDHIAATVNTLVLAYAGAALPLMILFTQVDEPFLQIINREIVAEEIIRTLVGSLGLISAVPITTWVASWMAVRTRPESIEEHSHGHHH